MFHTLRFRLLVSSILVVAVTVGIIALAATQATTQMFARYEQHQGLAGLRCFELHLAQYYEYKGSWDGAQSEVERIQQATGKRVILADAGGLVVADSASQLTGQQVDKDWGFPAMAITHHGLTVGSLYTDPSDKFGANGNELFLDPTNRALVVISVVAGLCAVLLIVGVSRRALAPVEALTAAARKMEAGDLTQRVQARSRDEIGDLAHAFNSMADGLAQLEELRRQMVTDVAHELRTPLSNIRGYLEALQDGVVRPDEGVIESIGDADGVIVCPSNPIVSIGPIIAIKGVREALKETMAKVVAISPIVGGATIKGPADKLMRGLGLEVSAYSVAFLYRDFLDVFILDEVDRAEKEKIEGLGLKAVTANTVMQSLQNKVELARLVLETLE